MLLIEFDTLVREFAWASNDVHEVGTQADFRRTFSETAFDLLLSMSRKERMRERARSRWGAEGVLSRRLPAASRPESM